MAYNAKGAVLIPERETDLVDKAYDSPRMAP